MTPTRAPNSRTTPRAAALLVVLVGLIALPATAQQRGPQHLWEITPMVGIGWGGKIDFESSTGANKGDIEIEPGPFIGGRIAARVSEEGMGFISYQFQRTTADVNWDGGIIPSQSIDLNIGLIQVGGELELPMNPHLVPFIGLSIGATHMAQRDASENPEWFFSGSFFAGAKVPITRYFGLRFHMSMLATVIQNNSDILCVSSGGLTCVSSTDLDSMIQGDFMGGFYIAF
jgi:hypothetical protein